jgi:DNA-binding MarR family transcriptional regulator
MNTIAPELSLGCTCFRLRSLTRAVTRRYDAHLARAGLKTTQYSLLLNLLQAPLTVAQLAAALSMERTTLTRNLKPLLESDYVTVAPGEDARQRCISLTAAGRAALKRGRQEWQRAQVEMGESLGLPALARLHRALEAAMARLGDPA